MKKARGGVILLIAVLCAGLLPAQEGSGPKIVARELRHDFGKIAQGTQAIHIFEVSNAGSEPLIIERLQTS